MLGEKKITNIGYAIESEVEFIHPIFIIQGFPICKFPYLLKFVYNSQVNIQGNFTVFHGHPWGGKKLGSPLSAWSSWGQARSWTICLLVLLALIDIFFLSVLLWSTEYHIFHSFMLWVGDLTLPSSLPGQLKVLLSVPKYRKSNTLWRK